MKRLLTLHLWCGLLVSLPLLGWSLSGFFLALPPGTLAGQPYRVIETDRVTLKTPHQVVKAVEEQAGRPLEVTAITLEQRGNTLSYNVFGKEGRRRVNAVTGEVTEPAPPSARQRWIGYAHFFNFAGTSRVPLLLLFSALTTLSSLSGLILLVSRYRRERNWPSPRR